LGSFPTPSWGPYGQFDEQDPAEVCIGRYFVSAFRGVYDTLRFTKPVPNWQQDDYLLDSTDQTCHSYPSCYENFGFSYQGSRFIATDFITRNHAPRVPFGGWPGLDPDPDTYSGEPYHWTLDWLESQVEDVQDGERIVCLGHNAYMKLESLGVDISFTTGELEDIWNCGLKNNKPIATSVGGHLLERFGRQLYGSDTICDFFMLDPAAEGHVYVFRVKDSVRLQVTHYNPGPALAREVYFTATYSWQGDHEPTQYWWDFGDGTHTVGGVGASHQYLDPARDTVYKVSVRVTTESGRRVWASDTVYVEHAPGGWAELTPMLAEPSGKAIKEGGCMTYDVYRDLIYASKGYKTGDFYSYNVQTDTWKYLDPGVPLGEEQKPPYKGSVICSDGVGSLFLTKGNNTCGFWRYWAATNFWLQLANVPTGPSGKKVKQGASLTWAPHDGTGSDTGFIYLLKGYRNEFYRYNPRNNDWQTLEKAPAGPANRVKYDAGSWLVADLRPGAHMLYAFKAKYHELYAYDTDADSWLKTPVLSPMPIEGRNGKKKAKDGSCAVWYDGSIYAFKGGNTQEFWRYFPELDTWQEQETIPRLGSTGRRRNVKGGGALSAHPSFGVLAFKGNKTLELWRYVPVQALGLAARRVAGGGSVTASGGSPLGGELPLMDGLEASKPRWNWQGTMVCYSKEDTLTQREQIYQFQYGSSNPEQRVVDMDEDCEEPVYSPNGQYIAFQLDDTVSDFYQLCVTPATGSFLGGGGLSGEKSDVASAMVPVASENGDSQVPSTGTVPGRENPAAIRYSPLPAAHGGLGTVPMGGQSPTMSVDESGSEPSRRAVYAGPGLEGVTASLGPVWQITFAAGDHCYPEWSQDNQWLCYERDDENYYTQIWRVPALGGLEEQLTFGNEDHYLPSYLNQYEIVFTLSPMFGYDLIAKVNVLTHQVTVLSQFDTDHDNPSPSWNGLAVASEAVDDSGNTQIVKTCWPTGETWLTSGSADITAPDYGQDNQWIAAVRWTGVTSQIVWVDALNGGYTAVTDSFAIRDNPDAYIDDIVSNRLAVYEREAWDPMGLLLAGGRRKHGSGIYLSKSRKPKQVAEGSQGASIGILALDNAKPNPASGRVAIRWQVPVEAQVSLRVYNTAGQLVRVLAEGKTKPGAYESIWNGTDARGRRLANGVYFYALDNGAKRISRKVVLTE